MSETPRTDKFCLEPYKDQSIRGQVVEWVNFASRLETELAAAQRELADLKDLANGLIEFAKEMLPICPEKARKMLVRGIEKGRDMRTNATAEIERLTAERDRYREALEKIVDWAICDRDKHGRAGMAGGYAIARAALAGAGEGE